MDKLGRRILLLLSAGLMVISISLLGLYFFIEDNLGNKTLGAKISWLPVTSLSVFVSVFSIGFGPIPWLMMSELFSPEVKSVASSLSTTFNWTLAFLVTKFFSNMVVGVTEAGHSGCLVALPSSHSSSASSLYPRRRGRPWRRSRRCSVLSELTISVSGRGNV